jgi:hypothetical protein
VQSDELAPRVSASNFEDDPKFAENVQSFQKLPKTVDDTHPRCMLQSLKRIMPGGTREDTGIMESICCAAIAATALSLKQPALLPFTDRCANALGMNYEPDAYLIMQCVLHL